MGSTLKTFYPFVLLSFEVENIDLEKKIVSFYNTYSVVNLETTFFKVHSIGLSSEV